MPKFKVYVHGKDYEIQEEKRKFFLMKEITWKPINFYATRFVDCESANEAIEQTFDIVNKEIAGIGRATSKSKLELKEIQEDDELFDIYAPGKGFTFYREDG